MHSPVATFLIVAVKFMLTVARRIGFGGWRSNAVQCVPSQGSDALPSFNIPERPIIIFILTLANGGRICWV